ncbi:MAG: NAD(P)-binding domain-containing protein, partial [Lachnospiraceae bacterium]|nr:NAD(P)-binding domain-containing protein [Lachnospiraceae bacterium]
MKIGFIGLGNMAKAMIGGMLRKEIVRKCDILGSARSKETLETVRRTYGIETKADNREVAREADVLILAVKPQFFQTVIE